MSYLRYNTPLPEPLPDDAMARMLIDPLSAPTIMHEYQRVPADYMVRPSPSEPGQLQIICRLTPRTPITISTRRAQRAAERHPETVIPPGATCSDLHLEALSKAIRQYLDDSTPYAQSEPITPLSPDSKAATTEWLFDGDVGISSRAIAHCAYTRRLKSDQIPHPPADHADFGRCLQFLAAVPEATIGLDILARHDPRWDFLRDHWQLLSDCREREAISGQFVQTDAIIQPNFRTAST